MKVVAICGSMKFADQMKEIAYELESEKGVCVIQPTYNEKKRKESIENLERIFAGHVKKLELADAIYVVNINGYIGEQTKSDIAYAKKNKMEIIYHEK